MAAKVDEKKCIGCGACEGACPVSAIQVDQGIAKVSADCIECGACVSVCPQEAIALP